MLIATEFLRLVGVAAIVFAFYAAANVIGGG